MDCIHHPPNVFTTSQIACRGALDAAQRRVSELESNAPECLGAEDPTAVMFFFGESLLEVLTLKAEVFQILKPQKM